MIPVPGGGRFAPAYAMLRDFERAKREIGENVTSLPAWTPILHAYAGGLVDYCHQQIALSQDIVAGWLERYMLQHRDARVPARRRAERAKEIAAYFGSEQSYERFRTHGRPIRLEELREIESLRVRRLEDDKKLQDAVLSIYHALDFTFQRAAVKIVENHLAARYVRIQQQVLVGQPMQSPTPAPE